MLTVNLICIGKLKESFWRDACAEYAKRLGAYCKFNIIELDEQRLPKAPTQGDIDRALSLEAERIAAKCPSGAHIIAMCIEGKQLSSEQLAAHIDKTALGGTSCVCVIIGSSCGLAPEIKQRAALRLSMSPMTFPHQLARVMLCEQLYRAFSITNGGQYHK